MACDNGRKKEHSPHLSCEEGSALSAPAASRRRISDRSPPGRLAVEAAKAGAACQPAAAGGTRKAASVHGGDHWKTPERLIARPGTQLPKVWEEEGKKPSWFWLWEATIKSRMGCWVVEERERGGREREGELGWFKRQGKRPMNHSKCTQRMKVK